MIAQADDEVVAGTPFWSPALPLAGWVQRWLRLVEGEAIGDDTSVSGGEDGHEGRPNGAAARLIGGVAGQPEKPCHLLGPLLFLDLDQCLKFTQMMSIAQSMEDTFESYAGIWVMTV